MKRMIVVMMLLLAFLLCNFYGAFDKVQAQGQAGRLIFLCGQTTQQVMDQMAPLVPKITKDQYNFIYLSYTLPGNTVVIFQFYQDKLAGLLIGEATPPVYQETPYQKKAPEQKIPYKIR